MPQGARLCMAMPIMSLDTLRRSATKGAVEFARQALMHRQWKSSIDPVIEPAAVLKALQPHALTIEPGSA